MFHLSGGGGDDFDGVKARFWKTGSGDRHRPGVCIEAMYRKSGGEYERGIVGQEYVCSSGRRCKKVFVVRLRNPCSLRIPQTNRSGFRLLVEANPDVALVWLYKNLVITAEQASQSSRR